MLSLIIIPRNKSAVRRPQCPGRAIGRLSDRVLGNKLLDSVVVAAGVHALVLACEFPRVAYPYKGDCLIFFFRSTGRSTIGGGSKVFKGIDF